LTLLLENATDDSVEVAVGFLKECGQKLGEVSPRGLTAVFDRLRHVLHEADLDKRVKYMIEVMFQVRKDGFKDNPAVLEELNLVEEEDQFTHLMSTTEESLDAQDILSKQVLMLYSTTIFNSFFLLRRCFQTRSGLRGERGKV
jgi:pre-mRNA-splicing factor CWC22